MPTCAGISGSCLRSLGRLDLALAVYAVYFPLRAIAGVVRKAVAHA